MRLRGLVTSLAALVVVLIVSLGSGTAPADRAVARGPLFLATVYSVWPADDTTSKIEILDGAGVVVRVLSPTTSWGLALWSPGRWRLAWADDAGLWVERADGTSKRLILPSQRKGAGARNFVWSPDGRQLLVAVGGRANGRLVLVDATSGALRDIVQTHASHTSYVPIAFSPDGRLVAFERDSGERGSPDCCVGDLVISRSDGRAARTLFSFGDPIHDGAYGAAWSPDGRWIDIATDEKSPHDPAFGLLDTSSGALRRISGLEPIPPEPWSPDAKRIAVVRLGGGPIMTMRTSGGDVRPLGVRGGYEVHWEPNGRIYVVAGDRTGALYAADTWMQTPRLLFRLPRGTVFMSVDPTD
jgi:hypothetical protein